MPLADLHRFLLAWKRQNAQSWRELFRNRSSDVANNNNNKDAKSPNSVLLIAASLIAAVRLNR